MPERFHSRTRHPAALSASVVNGGLADTTRHHQVAGQRHDPVRREEEVRDAAGEVVRQVRVEQRDDGGDHARHAERAEHQQHRHRDRDERQDEEDVHRRADAAGDRAERFQADEVQVVEGDREVEELLGEGRAEVAVAEEPDVVDAALGEHLVVRRVRLEGVDTGGAARRRERNVEVGVPQLEDRHEEDDRGDRYEDRVEEERAALARRRRPLHGGTVVTSTRDDPAAARASRVLWLCLVELLVSMVAP